MKKNSIATPHFIINMTDKTFEMSKKTFLELADPTSEVSKAIKNYKSMGYNYMPVCRQRSPQNRNTIAQRLTFKMIEDWIDVNNPGYMNVWKAYDEVKNPAGKKFPPMVRRSVFLYENYRARQKWDIGDYNKAGEDGKETQPREYNPTQEMKNYIRIRNRHLEKNNIKLAGIEKEEPQKEKV